MSRTVLAVPAILTDSKQEFRNQVEKINTFASRVQIDLTDGELTTAPTIDLSDAWWPKTWQVDLHMMVMQPSQHLPYILKFHPSLCIFHAEASEDLLPIFQTLKDAGIKTGVAFMKSTFPGKYRQYIDAADHALIFAGELGKQGAKADMLQIEKIPLIRAIKNDIEIGWDGGANLNNFRALAHADLDIINVGSALSTASDPAAMYQALVAETDKNGVVI